MRTCARSEASRLENGSSSSSTDGLGAMARAERDALLLTTRERVGHPVAEAGQAHQVQRLVDAW